MRRMSIWPPKSAMASLIRANAKAFDPPAPILAMAALRWRPSKWPRLQVWACLIDSAEIGFLFGEDQARYLVAEIEASLAAGLAFLWQAPGADPGQARGMAVLMTWVPRVLGLSVLACPPGQGRPFLGAILAQVFGPLNAHRIGLDVTTDNTRAIRLYEHLGFQREGHVRECWQRPAGDWVDCYLYGLLAKEWTP
jgi:ribosomal protein S18 acetylase RimI-like enzyme